MPELSSTTTELLYDVYLSLKAVLSGKDYNDLAAILSAKDKTDLGGVLEGYLSTRTSPTKFLSITDKIKLRSTNVYASPRTISPLQFVYGDLSTTKISCLPLDANGYLYHVADHPVYSIGKIYVDGEEADGGYSAYPSYADETGRSIAAIYFSTPKYEKTVTTIVRGRMNSDGTLMTNPADQLKDILLNIQEYSEDILDLSSLSTFKSQCDSLDISTSFVLNDKEVILKTFFDEFAMNIWAYWMISNGKSVIRLKGWID